MSSKEENMKILSEIYDVMRRFTNVYIFESDNFSLPGGNYTVINIRPKDLRIALSKLAADDFYIVLIIRRYKDGGIWGINAIIPYMQLILVSDIFE